MSRVARRTLAVALVALLPVLSCSAEGTTTDAAPVDRDAGDDTGRTDPSATDPDEAEDATTTTSVAGRDEVPTVAELEAILPTLDDVPSGFRDATGEDDEDDDDESSDDDDQAFFDACPGLADYADQFTSSESAEVPDLASRRFEGRQQEQIEVSFTTADDIPPGGMATYVDAFADCEPITIEEDDSVMTMEFEVTSIDLGDDGMELILGFDVRSGVIGFDGEMALRTFVVGPVVAEVWSVTGLDERTFEPVTVDPATMDAITAQVEADLRDLVG